ncbi:MAG: hypothetical protein ACE5O2_13205, partial [Armatimonadota bacterium]
RGVCARTSRDGRRPKPPKQHIKDLFQRHLKTGYMQTVDAPGLLGEADTDVIADKCEHFKAFREDVLRVAGIDPQEFASSGAA